MCSEILEHQLWCYHDLAIVREAHLIYEKELGNPRQLVSGLPALLCPSCAVRLFSSARIR